MKVLVDTSVWVQFINLHPQIDADKLQQMVENDECVGCLPIKAELLSGNLNARVKKQVDGLFQSIPLIDLNWGEFSVWDQIISISTHCRKNKIALPGIVDRMLFLAARKASAKIWTLDGKFLKLARHFGLAFG